MTTTGLFFALNMHPQNDPSKIFGLPGYTILPKAATSDAVLINEHIDRVLFTEQPQSVKSNKLNRILPAHVVAGLLMDCHEGCIFRHIRRFFPRFSIADEERLGRPNIYWRIYEPGEPVGPMHKDIWFWHPNDVPKDKELVKCWIALQTEPLVSGLQIIPGSHNEPYHHETYTRQDGRLGIDFNSEPYADKIVPLPLRPGDAILFNYGLLHGGIPMTHATVPRRSMEFTLLV